MHACTACMVRSRGHLIQVCRCRCTDLEPLPSLPSTMLQPSSTRLLQKQTCNYHVSNDLGRHEHLQENAWSLDVSC